MCSDGEYLTGLWFEGSEDADKYVINCEEKELPVFLETEQWLDQYFFGKDLLKVPPIRIHNITPFRQEVIEIMNMIPYGQTMTYGEIANKIAKSRGLQRMSAQAVGGAVGWNPICIIIPCHRVIGTDGSLTGYGGGIRNKIALLTHEGSYVEKR
ncbi:methylated-DNA--[protein]-cysteine S-methyltransferase [Faecalicatena contorta]|nr:methylated-DNA--[protein]-cysteine S-methyltransferase [Faecalicatena contorta]MCF2683572.1 methylated-DNA--[protein]-cysteine S-methyltransferase [Faecalicatena contorta]